jgi:hypothetical protein
MDKKKTMIQQNLILSQQSQIQKVSKDTNVQTLQAVEDQVLADSISIVQNCLNFAEMGFDDSGHETVPPEWDDLPLREKEKRIRLAKATWLPSNEVPYGIKLAYDAMIGIIKARAAKESGTRVLNIENATFPAPSPLVQDLEILDVDE